MLARIERGLTYKPDNHQYDELSRFRFEVAHLENQWESTVIYSHVLDDRSPIILFSHGNTGNISFASWYYDLFQQIGFSFVTYDYPGYGIARGNPSEQALYRSGEAVADFVFERSQGRCVVAFGVSLGGAVACEIATRRRFAGLILESIFSDTRTIGRHLSPYPLMHLLVPNRFRNIEKAARINTPLLLTHGTDDETSPLRLGMAVFDAHPGPKEKLVVQGGGHREIGRSAPELYKNTIRSFIEKVCHS